MGKSKSTTSSSSSATNTLFRGRTAYDDATLRKVNADLNHAFDLIDASARLIGHCDADLKRSADLLRSIHDMRSGVHALIAFEAFGAFGAFEVLESQM